MAKMLQLSALQFIYFFANKRQKYCLKTANKFYVMENEMEDSNILVSASNII